MVFVVFSWLNDSMITDCTVVTPELSFSCPLPSRLSSPPSHVPLKVLFLSLVLASVFQFQRFKSITNPDKIPSHCTMSFAEQRWPSPSAAFLLWCTISHYKLHVRLCLGFPSVDVICYESPRRINQQLLVSQYACCMYPTSTINPCRNFIPLASSWTLISSYL